MTHDFLQISSSSARKEKKNQYNGLLVPPRNTNKLSQAIIKICKSKSLRKKFMDNNLKLAKKSFSLDKVINIHFKIYETY